MGTTKTKNRSIGILDIPLLNEYESRKEWERNVWRILGGKSFLAQFLSPVERRAILYRVACADRIKRGVSTMEISRELWLSRQTISAIRKSFTEGDYRSSRMRGHRKRAQSEIVSSPRHRKRKRRYSSLQHKRAKRLGWIA